MRQLIGIVILFLAFKALQYRWRNYFAKIYVVNDIKRRRRENR